MKIKTLLVTTEEEVNKIANEGGHCKQAMTTVCITDKPRLAKKLAKRGLPCIYIEMPGAEEEFVEGADFIIQGQLDYEAGSEENYGIEQECLLRIWQRHYRLPWTIVQTERLLVRESVMEDLAVLLTMYEAEAGNPDVKPFSEKPQEELRAYICNRYPFYGYGLWSVVEKASGRVIGRAGLEDCFEGIELSYLMESTYRRQGYALEAAEAILKYADKELEMKEIYLRTSDGNTASLALAQKLRFEEYKREGSKKLFRLYL